MNRFVVIYVDNDIKRKNNHNLAIIIENTFKKLGKSY